MLDTLFLAKTISGARDLSKKRSQENPDPVFEDYVEEIMPI